MFGEQAIRERYEPFEPWSVAPGQRPLEPGTVFAVAVLQLRR